MIELIKPVRYGPLVGLLGLVFGIGWAFWLVLGHERIHKSLEERARQGIYQQKQGLEQTHQHSEEGKSQSGEGHSHIMEEGAHTT